jgi:hypothetical protein
MVAARMPDRRIAEIAAEQERLQREQEARADAEFQRIQAWDQFEFAWMNVYPQARQLTDEVAVEVTRRYMALAEPIRQRLWDFQIAEWLSRSDLHHAQEVAVRLLALACVGDDAELKASLLLAKSIVLRIIKFHCGLFEHFGRYAATSGLPYTPALSREELARCLGITYPKLQGDMRAGRWQPHPDDTVKYQRRRRWRHSDCEQHGAALKRIREKFPEKLWPNLRAGS